MSDLKDLAEEAAEANDAVWFKDNASRMLTKLAQGTLGVLLGPICST